MTASTVTQLDYGFKEFYKGTRVESLTLQDNVLCDMLPKDTSFRGDNMPLPVLVDGPQGIAIPFATAQTNSINSTGRKFNVNVGSTYGVVQFDDKVMALAEGEGAFLPFMNFKLQESEEFMRVLGHVANIQLWGNGGGSIGRRASVSGSTVTLTNLNDIVNFHVGQVITASDNDGSLVAHTQRVGSHTVTAVNTNAGTYTFTGTITDFANNDYLFRQGVFAGDITQTELIKGMQAWVPSADPAPSDSHFGLDRSVSTKLSGVRLPTAEEAGYIKDRLDNITTRAFTRYGTRIPIQMLNPEKWKLLSRELQNQGLRIIDKQNYDATWGYDSIEMITAGGKVSVLSDRDCPFGAAFGFNPQYLKIWSNKDLWTVMNGDGLSMLRAASAAAYEMRWRMYAQLACTKTSTLSRVNL
jgi:hypothetical protein